MSSDRKVPLLGFSDEEVFKDYPGSVAYSAFTPAPGFTASLWYSIFDDDLMVDVKAKKPGVSNEELMRTESEFVVKAGDPTTAMCVIFDIINRITSKGNSDDAQDIHD